MTTSFTTRTLFSGILIASTFSTMTYAAAPVEGFTVTPSIGFYNGDANKAAGNDTSYSIGIGYQTNTPLALEAVLLHSDADIAGKNHNLNQYRLDALYSLPEFTTTKLTPYVAAGTGINNIGGSDPSTNLIINIGGGVKYELNQDVSLRADYRVIKDLEDHYTDNIASFGIQYSFGEKLR